MHLSAAINLLEVSCRTLKPDQFIDWHTHWHDELCLVLKGSPTVGQAGCKSLTQVGALFLLKENEMHGVWNTARTTAKLWSVEFQIESEIRAHFRDLFDRSVESRILNLSLGQRRQFCLACQKLALEKGGAGFLNVFAASAWLSLQLVEVTRWFLENSETGFVDSKEEIDPQCLELWRKIQQQVRQPSSPGPMLFGLNPSHDSLRHRFRKIYGISPQGMLIRLRMERAKDLLRNGKLSVKEIAQQLGYSRQHDLSRAFHKYAGTSPSEWKVRANGLRREATTIRDNPEMRKPFPDLVKTLRAPS